MPRNDCASLSREEQRERLERMKRDAARCRKELEREARRAAHEEKHRILADLKRLRRCATCPAMRDFLARKGGGGKP
jgi:hypothetical protein